MSITSITYMVLIHISCILHATHCTHVWPNQHAHLSIVQYAIMCTCICEKYIQAMLNTYCWSGFVSLPILFLFHECEGVGATSYKKWPMLIMIQLSPLTRYFVRPKKPVHALNISQTAENTLFLGPWFNVRSHSIINFIRKGWETTIRANSIVLNTHTCKKPVLKMCYSYKKLSIHIWSGWEMRIMHLWDTLHFHMRMRYRVYDCARVRNAAKKLTFDKKLGTGFL